MTIDPVFTLLLLLVCGLWCFVGFQLCRITHKQRGIESRSARHRQLARLRT
jgi:hypothetical protein